MSRRVEPDGGPGGDSPCWAALFKAPDRTSTLINGGELSQIWWPVMAALGLAGVTLLVTAVSLRLSS
jgi:hypothetical protein